MARKEEPSAAELRRRLEAKRRRERENARRYRERRHDDADRADALRHHDADAPSDKTHNFGPPYTVNPEDRAKPGTNGLDGGKAAAAPPPLYFSHDGSFGQNGHANGHANGHQPELTIVRRGNWLATAPALGDPEAEKLEAWRTAARGVLRGQRLRLRHAQLLLEAEALGLKRRTPQHRDWMALAYARAIAEERARDGEPWG